jgi:predicted N-acetyltransferase YhbS
MAVHAIQDHAGGFNHEALASRDSLHAFDTDNQILIGNEQAGDAARREALLDSAFGRKERFAKTCQRMRDGRVPAHGLSLVARKDGAFVGTLRMWHVDAGGVPALLLGPLAVSASHRSEGIGSLLMDEALSRAKHLGHRAVILVGDAPYYARWGFSRGHTLNLAMPGPVEDARFLGLELQDGALQKAQGLVKPTGALDLRTHRPRHHAGAVQHAA